jgi:hypothetical protein
MPRNRILDQSGITREEKISDEERLVVRDLMKEMETPKPRGRGLTGFEHLSDHELRNPPQDAVRSKRATAAMEEESRRRERGQGR